MFCRLVTPRPLQLGGKPLVIAHRGASGFAPENTMVAFHQAVQDGADAIELDVRFTRDKQVVVFHDLSVERTTDGTGKISELTLEQIRRLDAGHRFTIDAGYNFPFRNRRIAIPMLEQVLQEFPSTPLYIDIKVSDSGLVDAVLALVDKYDRFHDVTFVVVVKTKKNALARYIRSKAPFAKIGHSGSEVARLFALSKMHLPGWFKPRGWTMQVPVHRNGVVIATPDFIRDAHRLGLQVQVWTVDDEDEMKRLLAAGADALFTSFPATLRKIVDSGKWLEKPVPR